MHKEKTSKADLPRRKRTGHQRAQTRKAIAAEQRGIEPAKNKIDLGTLINISMLICTMVATFIAYQASKVAKTSLNFEQTALLEVTNVDVSEKNKYTDDGFLLETSVRIFFVNTGGKDGSLDYADIKVNGLILGEYKISPDMTNLSQWAPYTNARYAESGEIAGPGVVIAPGNSKVLAFTFSPPEKMVDSHSHVELSIHTNSGQEIPIVLQDSQFVISISVPDQLIYLPDFDGNCNYSSIAGEILGLSGATLTGIPVRVEGNGLDVYTVTGMNPRFGKTGFEVIVSDKPISSEFKVTLFDQRGIPLSKPVTVITSDSCQENLVFIRFIETR